MSSTRSLLRLAAALGCVSVSYAATYLTWPILQPTPMALFYASVVAATWLGGPGGGSLSTVLSALCAYYSFVAPFGAFGTEPKQLAVLVTFVSVAAFLVFLVGRQQRAANREREQRRWLAGTLSSIGDAVIATDPTGHITFMNGAAERLTGWRALDAEGRDLEEVFSIFNEQTRERTENPVKQALETGCVVGLANHTVLIAKDGRETAIEDSAAPIKDDKGTLRGVILVFHDATPRRQAERAQKLVAESEERFRALVNATSDVVYCMNPDWSEMQPLEGRGLIADNDVVIRDWMSKNIPAFERGRVTEAIKKAITQKQTFELEHQVNRPDGTLGWTFSKAIPILDAGGNIAQWFGMASDATRRKEAEAEKGRLEAENERERRIYHAALSNTPDLVYVFGLDHRFTYANEALLTLWGRTREQALGKTCLELGYEPWHAEMHDREIDQVVATRQPIRGEVPFNGTNGRRVYDYIFVPVIDQDGAVVAVAGTTRDVTERQQAEQAIREQAQRLREADRRKDEFLAMLAHELRNPLAAIGNAVSLTTKSGLQQHIDWAMGVITRQMKQLTHLIDDLLDVSRISRGKIDLRKDVVELTPILESAMATVAPLIGERKHTLETAIEPENLWVNVDPTRLEQAVVNLLNNAAKYSENGGHITLSARTIHNEVIISVLDRGLGIPPDKLPQMFELFAQGDRSLARSEGGLGIGLTVVKKLVEMHGGRVEAKSDGPGKGSEFTIWLPRAKKPSYVRPVAKPKGSATVPSKAARILVVDDSEDTARGLARLLTLLGHDVAVSHNGIDGIEAARSLRPEFVLLDIGLPGMDGYEIATRLRQDESCKNAVIIAISGYGQEEDRRRSKQAGFDHHLIKPLDQDALLSILSAGAM
jgi:PAS domain S-box-containing protein